MFYKIDVTWFRKAIASEIFKGWLGKYRVSHRRLLRAISDKLFFFLLVGLVYLTNEILRLLALWYLMSFNKNEILTNHIF